MKFYCGTCGQDTGIGISWHCWLCATYRQGHHPVTMLHCPIYVDIPAPHAR